MSYFDLIVVYKIIEILSTPWEKTDAFKLGIINSKGFVLIPRKKLKTNEQKIAYSVLHLLAWNIKRLIEKLPGGQSKIVSLGAAAWLLHEPLAKETRETKNENDSQKTE